MPEKTFAANVKNGFKFLQPFVIPNDPEFLLLNSSIFESEDLVETLYEIYLTLIANAVSSQRHEKGNLETIGMAYINGFYLPCTLRIVLSGQIDLVNDTIPDYAGLTLRDDKDWPLFITVRKRERSRELVVPLGSSLYTVAIIDKDAEAMRRVDRRAHSITPDLDMSIFHVLINSQGSVVPYVNQHYVHSGKSATMYGLFCQAAAVTINAVSDSRHLWSIKTNEIVLGGDVKTPLTLGVTAEHVKSLFYARQMPVTETGRKRPILHWVKAHQRRIKEGIDIDIEKFLRGITEFEMESFAFQITNPVKRPKHLH